MNIQCRTLFDCTCTGVTGHFRSSQAPYHDRTGRLINNVQDWTHARNQHRNWETLIQMISLRAQPTIVSEPQLVDNSWCFEFSVETPGVYSSNANADNFDLLLAECDGIPMVIGLGERQDLESCLTVLGPKQNLWFQAINN